MPQPPCRAEHIGSLLRPASLTRAFRRFAAGEIDAAAFAAAQDLAIRDAVAMQRAVGLRIVTDGEFRRGSYWGHFIDAIDGLGVEPAIYRFRDDAGDEQDFIAPHVAGKVRRSRAISVDDFRFLDGLAIGDARIKITMPSPPTFHFYRGRESLAPGAYADPSAFFADFAAIYRAEIAALAAAGARYLQIDDVPFAMLCDSKVREAISAGGDDPFAWAELYVKAINAALADRPADVTVGIHLCRGNFKGKYLSEGGYEPVAERLFQGLNVDAFFLEYDTGRAGDFMPLRFVPADRHVVLGLMSSKIPDLESIDALRARIDAAGAFVDPARLSISPQCGFASAVSGNPVSEDYQRRKLARLVETAEAVWGHA